MRALITFTLFIFVIGCNGNHPSKSRSNRQPVADSDKPPKQEVVCPVCGLTFDINEAVGKHTFQNKTYYFLIKDHWEAFSADPNPYLGTK